MNSDKNVEQTNKEIAELQNELKRQQLIRRNKEEYNEVAGQVRQYEPRTEMERYGSYHAGESQKQKQRSNNCRILTVRKWR